MSAAWRFVGLYLLIGASMPASILCGQTLSGAQIAVDGLIDGRARVIAGEFTAIEWHWTGTAADDDFARTDIYCAFDAANEAFRFDRKRKVGVIESPAGAQQKSSPENTNGIPAWSHIEDLEVKYVRLADKSLHWTSSGKYQVTVKRREDVLRPARPFHMNSIGLATSGDLLAFPELQKLVDVFMGQDLQSSEKSTDGQQLLVWRFADGSLQRRLWLDPSKDYAPTRMEIRTAGGGPESASAKPIVTIVTEWDRVKDVWVPVRSAHVEDRQGKEFKSYEIEIAWSRVNEDVSEETFTASGFGLARFARVVDTRLGVPVVLEKIGPNYAERVENGAAAAKAEKLNDSPSRLWILWLNLAVLFALVAFFIMRQRRQSP
jgi:hypothetical protein